MFYIHELEDNATQLKSLQGFLKEIDKLILNFIWQYERPRIVQKFLKIEKMMEDLI